MDRHYGADREVVNVANDAGTDIWNHPDVLYHFLRKRSEQSMLIEEDLDLEEIGGITKARARNKNGGIRQKPGPKPKGGPKKPAATIPPNTSTGAVVPRQDSNFGNSSFPPNGPYGPSPYRPDQSGAYPPYPNYQNQPGYSGYPPNQGYNQNYDSNYYNGRPYRYGRSIPGNL